jgi:hypothetical protein
MTRCRLVGWFCYRTSDRVHIRAGAKVNSRKRSRDGAILCWRWRSWAVGATPQAICMNTGRSEKCKISQEDKQPQNVPGQGQDRMAHKGSLVSDIQIAKKLSKNTRVLLLWEEFGPARTRLKPRWLEKRKIYYAIGPAPGSLQKWHWPHSPRLQAFYASD